MKGKVESTNVVRISGKDKYKIQLTITMKSNMTYENAEKHRTKIHEEFMDKKVEVWPNEN